MLFGLAKQWTPVMCSGLSLAGEPQVPFASLPMLLGYALGPLPGIVASNIAYLTLGWIGGYLYSGLWFPERTHRALAASLYIGNGFFICRLVHGHLDFMPFLALPFALWVIHRTAGELESHPVGNRPALTILLLGCLFTLVIDGSPVAIIHWLFWVGTYCATLSYVRRSLRPLWVFCAAFMLMCVLDAGYLWPMLNAQANFPRLTDDTFTGPWSLLWFLLLPMRGKVLPSNGTGIELSVFIGPVLFYLIWRYRYTLFTQLPRELRLPLLVVSVVSIWLGMGSLRLAHVPIWLSPFDWLRPLPGFRSIGVTGRYWGFLALPLSLLAAAALVRYAGTERPTRRSAVLILGAFLIQIGFQGESLLAAWWPSRVHRDVALEGLFNGRLERIATVENPDSGRDPHQQGEYISPVRAVVNCYDMDSFTRAEVRTGNELVKTIHTGPTEHPVNASLEAGFMTWNRMRILTSSATSIAEAARHNLLLHIELNQAYHTGWRSPQCAVTRAEHGNLVAICPARELLAGPIDLVFFDPVSELGKEISIRAAIAVGATAGLLAALALIPKRRTSPAPSIG